MISVLTVNYHTSEDLTILADSLREHAGGHKVELIVTNNSVDDPVHLASDKTLPTTVLPSANVGFGRGINLAWRQARGEIIFITNPDVRIVDRTFDPAVSFLQKRVEVGILLPLLRYPDGRIQPSVRRFYTWPVVLYARSPLRAVGLHPSFFRKYLYEDMDRSRPTDVDWGLGGAMFLRREDVGPDGIFDERFFLYFEDVDLCYNTWARGRGVVYCPQVQCIHAHRRGSRMPLGRAGWHHFRGLLRFVAKHHGLPQRPRLD